MEKSALQNEDDNSFIDKLNENHCGENDNNIVLIWPHFKTKFAFGRSNMYTKKLVEKCCEDCNSLSNSKEKSFDKYKDLGLFGACFYPKCNDILKMEILVKIMLYFAIIDDHSECVWGDSGRDRKGAFYIWKQFLNMIDKLSGKEILMLDWKPYIFGWYSCLDAVFSKYSSIQKNRAIKLWKDYAIANIEESHYFKDKIFNSVAEGLDLRKKFVGMYPLFQLIEYSEGIELAEDEWNDPLLQLILEKANESIIYFNDLMSFHKEIVDSDGDIKRCSNLIAFFCNDEKLSLQASVDKLYEMSINNEKKIEELEKEYFATRGASDKMKHFIECVNLMIGGNYLSHFGCFRYKTFLKEHSFTVNGRMVYNKKKDPILEEKSIESFRAYFEF